MSLRKLVVVTSKSTSDACSASVVKKAVNSLSVLLVVNGKGDSDIFKVITLEMGMQSARYLTN